MFELLIQEAHLMDIFVISIEILYLGICRMKLVSLMKLFIRLQMPASKRPLRETQLQMFGQPCGQCSKKAEQLEIVWDVWDMGWEWN